MGGEITQNLIDQINELYRRKFDPLTFNFDALRGPHIFDIVPPAVVDSVNYYVTCPKYSSNTKAKIEIIDKILLPYGLIRFAAGTNRAVYRYQEDQTFCVKVAIDKTGMTNNPDELKNQDYLKPFVNKIFSVSPKGTMATVERVTPIRSRQEFAAVAGDIFDVIANKFIGKYVLEDIGTIWFKNWGIRPGFGPVLLDYPYLFEVDIRDLYCYDMTPLGLPCGGQIDYDAGFNILICTKCGKRYNAKQIGKALCQKIITFKGGLSTMDNFHVVVKRGEEVLVDKQRADSHINPDEVNKPKKKFSGSGWSSKDFDIILTLGGIKYGKKDGVYTKLGESNGKAVTKQKPAKENPYRGIITNIPNSICDGNKKSDDKNESFNGNMEEAMSPNKRENLDIVISMNAINKANKSDYNDIEKANMDKFEKILTSNKNVQTEQEHDEEMNKSLQAISNIQQEESSHEEDKCEDSNMDDVCCEPDTNITECPITTGITTEDGKYEITSIEYEYEKLGNVEGECNPNVQEELQAARDAIFDREVEEFGLDHNDQYRSEDTGEEDDDNADNGNAADPQNLGEY